MRRGFTLLELSIVLTLIAVILGGGLVTFTASLQAKEFNTTVARMDAIDKALLNFSVAYNRIPCPADLTIPPPSQSSTNPNYYGIEAATPGTCYGSTPAANFHPASGTGPVEGGVPTRTLKLSDDYMYDGWGRKFSYAVDPTYTVTGTLPAPASCSAPSTPITVYDASGAARTAGATYVLVSHGANGHGAYSSAGTMVNAGSSNANELTNCHCSNAGVANSTFTPTYVAMAPTIDPNSTNTNLDNFDDIATFKEAWQLQTQSSQPAPIVCPTLYIADEVNNVIRMVSPAGAMTTIAGNHSTSPYSASGPATTTALYYPWGFAMDSSGNLYFADSSNNVIRKVTPPTPSNPVATLSTIAGNHTAGYLDASPATNGKLNAPRGLAIDSSGNLYIADNTNYVIRKVTPAGAMTTIAGSNAAGGTYSVTNGMSATSAEFNPRGLAIDKNNNLYITDATDCVILKLTAATNTIAVVAGNGTCGYNGDGSSTIPATSVEINAPIASGVDSNGNLYIADTSNDIIRRVDAITGILTTVAGIHGTTTPWATSGTATSTALNAPRGVAFDNNGNMYISDSGNNAIRMVTPAGYMTTVAGNHTAGWVDATPATSGEVDLPRDVFLSPIFFGR